MISDWGHWSQPKRSSGPFPRDYDVGHHGEIVQIVKSLVVVLFLRGARTLF